MQGLYFDELSVGQNAEITRVVGSTYASLAPKWLAAQGRDPAAWQVEDLATGTLHTADGATLLLEASWAVHGPYADDDMPAAVLSLAGFVRSAPQAALGGANVVTVPADDGWVTLHASSPGSAAA